MPSPPLPTPHSPLALLAFLCVLSASAVNVSAGELNPPTGPVAPTPGPEPRIPLNATNTPGTAAAAFRITQPGSYYLTGNVGALSQSGIEIAANNVTIDLMGFNIQALFGAIKGISVEGVHNNLTVRNGTVSGFPQGGIILIGGVGALIEHVHASSNAGGGIFVGNNAVVRDCTASSNGNHGFSTGIACTLTNCSASLNASNGMVVGNACTVTGCTATSNSVHGFSSAAACSIINCSAMSNTLNGFNLGFASTITNCSALVNQGIGIDLDSDLCTATDCTAVNNVLNGIECFNASLIRGNTCTGGGGAGIHATGNDNRIEGNNCTGALRGIDVDAAGNIIIRNTCSGNTTNWAIVANNVVGPILDRTAPASALINGNTAPSSLGSTDANANYSY